jgi:uncharacterized damage-inducible protein DinB
MKNQKKLLLPVGFIAAVIMLLAFNSEVPKGETTVKTDQIVADWERAKAYTKEYLDASNDEVINFKPTAEMRTFGQQMLHIAEANYGIGAAATGKTSPVAFGSLEKSEQHKTKAAVTQAVMESYDFVIAAAKEMNETKLAEPVKVFNFDMTRELALSKVFEHQTHHRGQTTVYLRLKGLTPPQEKLF